LYYFLFLPLHIAFQEVVGVSKVSINTSDGLKCVLTMSLHESAGGCSGVFGFEAGTQWYFNGVKIKMGEYNYL
jgi:hypothetical protein